MWVQKTAKKILQNYGICLGKLAQNEKNNIFGAVRAKKYKFRDFVLTT